MRKIFPLVLALVIPSSVALAGPESVQSGDIEIEDTTVKRENPFVAGQRQAAAFLKGVSEATEKGGGAIPPLEEAAEVYLAAAYYYCTVKLGPCAFLLDAILQGDALASKGTSDTACPRMTAFWRAWLQNDMEARVQHDLPVGFLGPVNNFNAKNRPRYVKCAELVGSMKATPSDPALKANIKKAEALVNEIVSKQIDLEGISGLSRKTGRSTAKKEKK